MTKLLRLGLLLGCLLALKANLEADARSYSSIASDVLLLAYLLSGFKFGVSTYLLIASVASITYSCSLYTDRGLRRLMEQEVVKSLASGVGDVIAKPLPVPIALKFNSYYSAGSSDWPMTLGRFFRLDKMARR